MTENPYLVKIRDGADYRGRGILIKRLVSPSTTNSDNLVVSIAFQNPGEDVARHQHEYEEAYFVLQGEGIMTIGDSEEFKIERYDAVYTPANTPHWTISTGDETLMLLCAITPPPPV